jgi:hypothetical protein
MGADMPEKKTMERARKDAREGKAPSTQAGEFIREEMDHIREGKHGARSPEQAIAIGLSKARRAGVKVPPPKKGAASEETRRRAERDLERGQHPTKPDPVRSRASEEALEHEGTAAASPKSLSRHAKRAASERTAADRSRSARKAARTRAANKARSKT